LPDGQIIDTGLIHLEAVVGAKTKIGAFCGIMPGVKIGENCIVLPPAVLYKDVPDNTIVRIKQELEQVPNRMFVVNSGER
jgi:acetyltransferase-like isoleucine patch superfamily enzyme